MVSLIKKYDFVSVRDNNADVNPNILHIYCDCISSAKDYLGRGMFRKDRRGTLFIFKEENV